MKKIKVSKNIKKIIYGGLLFTSMIWGGLAIREATAKGTKEVENTSIVYSAVPEVNYTVIFNPNKIYERSISEKGYQYMSGYVNDIATKFGLTMKLDKNNDFKIRYNISSKIEAFVTEQEKEVIIWTKDMEVTNPKEISGENELIVNDTYLLNYDGYRALTKGIIEELKVSFNTRAIVKMNINVSWVDGNGIENEENYSPTIIVPLNTGYFAIKETDMSPINKEIKSISTEALPVNKKAMSIYSALLIITLMIFIVFMKNIEVEKEMPKGKRDLIRKKIFDDYGNRLVAIKEDNNTEDKIYVVKDVLDLVKIADEIEKPILYMGDVANVNNLYIIDGNIKYGYSF